MIVQIKNAPIETRALWAAACALQLRTGAQPVGFGKDIAVVTLVYNDVIGACKALKEARHAEWIVSDCQRRFPNIVELERKCPYCGVEVPVEGSVKKGAGSTAGVVGSKPEVKAAVEAERERALNERIDSVQVNYGKGTVASWEIGESLLAIKRARLHEADKTVVEKHFDRWCVLRFPWLSATQVTRLMTFANSVKRIEVERCQALGHVGWEKIRQGLLLIENEAQARSQKDVLIRAIVANLEELPQPTARDAAEATARVVAKANAESLSAAVDEEIKKAKPAKAKPKKAGDATPVTPDPEKRKPGRPKKEKATKPPKATKAEPPRRTAERMVALSGSLPVDGEGPYRNTESGLPVKKAGGKVVGRMIEIVFPESKKAIRIRLKADFFTWEIVPAKGAAK